MLGSFCNSIAWLVLLGAFLSALEWTWPAGRKGGLLRSDFVTDLIYWLSPYFLYGPLAPKPIAAGMAWIAVSLTGSPEIGLSALRGQPFWLQVVEAFVAADFISYWGHRWLHGRTLWAFHAIHHGAVEVDWLTTARNHPVNTVLQRLLFTAPLLLIGFPVAAILAIAPIGALYNILTHVNLDWRFGPLRRVFVSPMLHRWHHTPGIGCDRNFGEALAIWDVMFGTFFLPEGSPQRLGLDDGPPADIVGQTLWPAHYFLGEREGQAAAAH